MTVPPPSDSSNHTPDAATLRDAANRPILPSIVRDLQVLVEQGTQFSTIYADPPWPKPFAFRALIERVSPGPYLELYGREEQSNCGWTVYGNQVERRLF